MASTYATPMNGFATAGYSAGYTSPKSGYRTQPKSSKSGFTSPKSGYTSPKSGFTSSSRTPSYQQAGRVTAMPATTTAPRQTISAPYAMSGTINNRAGMMRPATTMAAPIAVPTYTAGTTQVAQSVQTRPAQTMAAPTYSAGVVSSLPATTLPMTSRAAPITTMGGTIKSMPGTTTFPAMASTSAAQYVSAASPMSARPVSMGSSYSIPQGLPQGFAQGAMTRTMTAASSPIYSGGSVYQAGAQPFLGSSSTVMSSSNFISGQVFQGTMPTVMQNYLAPQVVQQEVFAEQQIIEPEAFVQYEEQQAAPVEGQGMLNQAFVFIKPHAMTDITINTVRDMLMNYGINVTLEGDLTSDIIDERKLIDQHYYAIASKATILKPDQLPVDNDKFQGAFGITWEEALPLAFNAMDAMQALDSNADEISQLWAAAKDNKKLVKLGGGFYCGLLEKPDFQPIYVFNGFFMSMRSDYVAPGAAIHWFAVEWDEQAFPWSDFRAKVLGPTDPANCPPDSIRGTILANWQELGLASEPNVGNNGVHASASPIEALYERMNWLAMPCNEDPFGNYLLECGVPPEFIEHCSVDPQMTLDAEGKTGSVWDHLEDSDASACVQKFVDLVNLNMN